jgi:hypothetical protein
MKIHIFLRDCYTFFPEREIKQVRSIKFLSFFFFFLCAEKVFH